MSKSAGGIKALMLRRARIGEVPSTKGPCERCDQQGTVRYFVAAKLPRWMILCDKDYLRIRDALEEALIEILQGIGLHG